MRTTINLDDDVLGAVHELARSQKQSLGAVISQLVRKGLNPPAQRSQPCPESDKSFLGFDPLPDRGQVITNDLINRLRDEEGV